MSLLKSATFSFALVLSLSHLAMAVDSPNLGQPVSEADLAAWDISIGPDGKGLGIVVLRDNLDRDDPPHEHVIVFDEAQRAWDAAKVADFYGKKLPGFAGRLDRSEPELLLSARAMKGAMELIRPLLAARGTEPIGRVVIGTVKGDLHDIGKNLVAAMLEGGGFEVFDLGVNVSPEKFIAKVRETGATVLGMSALLTTTMPNMKVTIEAFKAAGLRDQVKILVGGAPVTQKFADQIGADGYGENAPLAVALAKRLLGVGV